MKTSFAALFRRENRRIGGVKIDLDKLRELSKLEDDRYNSFSPDCCMVYGQARRSPQRWAFFVREFVDTLAGRSTQWQNP
jgi:hypothetical protein